MWPEGGCLGNGFVAGLPQIGYKSKKFFHAPPLSGAEPPRSSRPNVRARSAAAREWRRCAGPWGEGSRGVGVGARGWCQGGGAPFDRLRANGLGKRACGGEWRARADFARWWRFWPSITTITRISKKTLAPGVSTCEPKGRGGSHSIMGKLLGFVQPATSGAAIRRLGRMSSRGLGRRPTRSPRWQRRGRGRCRR